MYFRRRICADSFPPLFHGGIFQEDITNIKEEKESGLRRKSGLEFRVIILHTPARFSVRE